MKKGNVTNLVERICQEYGFTREAAQDTAMQMLENSPPVLARNVEECLI